MKLVLKIALGIVVLVSTALVALLVLIDPNSFKPKIEALALEQNIALDMKGDMRWRFWPRLAFSLEDVSLAPLAARQTPIAQFRRAALALAIKPLLSGDIHIDEISLDGADIYLALDENGKGNWETLAKTSAAPNTQDSAAPSSSGELNLEVESIIISDAALSFHDLKAAQSFSLTKVNVDLSEVNTLGKPFKMAVNWVFDMSQAGSQEKLSLSGAMKSGILFSKDLNQVSLDNGELALTFQNRDSAQLRILYAADITGLSDVLEYQAKIDLQSTNAREILSALAVPLDTANPQAFGRVSLSAALKGGASSLSADPLTLGLDKTDITGRFAIVDIPSQALRFSLKGTSLNVDDYLPKPLDPSPSQTAAPPTTQDTPLPLAAMRALDIDGKLGFDAMTVQQLTLQSIELSVNAKNGLIKEDLRAKAYEGDIRLTSTTKVFEDKADLDFHASLQSLQIEPLLKDMAMTDGYNMSGAVDADLKGRSEGASVNQLVDQVNARLDFSGAQMRLSPLNIEEKFCKAVNLISQTPDTVDWADFTELSKFNGNVVWQENIIQLEQFKAGVSQLLLASTGRINLKSEKYEFTLPLSFTSAKDAENYQGCALSTSNYWADRGLSLLRCKGSIANVTPLKDCGLDSDGLKTLVKDYAEYKIRDKYGDKIDSAEQKLKEKKQELKEKKQELKSEAREDLTEKKQAAKEKIEDKVDEKKEELLNKLKKKLNK